YQLALFVPSFSGHLDLSARLLLYLFISIPGRHHDHSRNVFQGILLCFNRS
ncbi:hypothetical protein BGX38DRAFT_1192585, partial [Terfezia claveryi]